MSAKQHVLEQGFSNFLFCDPIFKKVLFLGNRLMDSLMSMIHANVPLVTKTFRSGCHANLFATPKLYFATHSLRSPVLGHILKAPSSHHQRSVLPSISVDVPEPHLTSYKPFESHPNIFKSVMARGEF